MAYYNPLNPKQGNNYYDPYYQSQEPGASVGQNLMGLAKTMAVIGVLNMAGQSATKWLSRKAGSALKNYSKGHLGSIARKMNTQNPTMGGIIRRTNTYKKIVKPLKRTSIYKAGQARHQRLESLKGKRGYGAARLTSAFKNPKTFLASTAGVWSRNVLQGMGVAYTIDSTLGITTRELGLEKKKWYDAPGQVSNFGRWLVNDSVAGLAMGGLGRIGGALGSAGMQGLRKTFSGEFGKKVMANAAAAAKPAIQKNIKYQARDGTYESMFNDVAQASIRSAQEGKFAGGVVSKALSFAKRMPGVMRAANAAIKISPQAFKSAQHEKFGVRTKKAFNLVQKAAKGAWASYGKRGDSLRPETQLGGLTAAKALHQLGLDSTADSRVGEKVKLITPEFKKNFLNKIEHANNKKSFMQEVFGFLKPLRNKDVINRDFWEETQGRLSQRYEKSEVTELLKHVKNMRVGNDLYVGTNAKGGGVDLSVFNPVLAMKRMVGHVANKRFNVPLTNWSINIGDMTGLNSALAQQPSFEFTRKRPAIALNDPRMDQVSVGELGEGTNPLFMYVDKSWAVFDGGSTKVANTGSILRYAPRGSRAKKLQIQDVNLKRWEKAAAYEAMKDDPSGLKTEKAAALFNKWKQQWEHRDAPENKYLNFLNTKVGLTVPKVLQTMASSLDDRLTGKGVKAKLAMGHLMDRNRFDPGSIYAGLPLIEDSYKKGSQVFSRILHNDHALDRIGMHMDAKSRGDFLDVARNDQSLMRYLDDIDWRADSYVRRKDFKRAAEEIKVNPNYAASHHAVKRMGPLSEMTDFDIARTNVIEDIFNKNFDVFSGNGKPHPILSSLPQLEKEGYITKQESNGLALWAKLSAFKDKGLFDFTGDPDNANVGKWVDTLKSIRHRSKENNWNLEQEILDFSRDFNIKSPKIRANQEKILPEGVQDFISDELPYASVRPGVGRLLDVGRSAFDSTTDLLEEFLPFKKRDFTHHGIRGNLKYVGNIVGVTAATAFAFRTADTVVAANPLFEDTMFDDGITGASADVIARARLGLAHVGDLTGVTSTMKYLHGLAPKSESFVPGAFLGTVAGMAFGGPFGAMKAAAMGGVINRIASPYLPDLSKSHEELERIYSGKEQVPVFKSPTWLLGGTPWEGTKVAAYQPNWYVRAKSRWEESDTLYDGAFRRLIHKPLPLLGINIGDFIDPYYMERRHYFSRPYPTTGKAFGEVPVIGSLLAGTIGRIVKPEKTMHQDFLYADTHTDHGPNPNSPFAITPPSYGSTKVLMGARSPVRSTAGVANSGGQIILPKGKAWSETAAEDFLYDIRNFAGLKGFMSGAITERIFGKETVIPTLEQAGRISSMSRAFYDKNLGGVGFLCLPPREKVLEKTGIKEIKNINIGDYVLSENHEYKKVTHTSSRKCTKGEKLYTITIGAGNTKIQSTWNHPFAIYKRTECSDNHNRPCIPNFSKKCLNCSRKNSQISFNWIPAFDIKIGDFAVMPLPKDQGEQIIDLSDYNSGGFTDEYIYFGSSDFGKAYELLENNICFTRSDLRKHVSDKVGKEAIRSFKHARKLRRYKRYHTIDPELSYFIGWWLAEGSSRDKSITFTLNINEINIAKKLGSIYNSKFGGSFQIYQYPEKNTCTLKITNKPLALYLKSFGNVYTKSMKELISLPDHCLVMLVEGLISGDGWLNNEKRQGGFTSASSKLVRDLWISLYRLGVQSTIVIDYLEKSKGYYPQGDKRKETTRSYLKFGKGGFDNLTKCFTTKKSNGNISTGRTFTYEGNLFMKITNVFSEDYSGKIVYDITVEDSHCFVGNYVLLHNSEPIRRLIDKPEYRQYGINPIPNMLPNWLPGHFLTGDPYSKIMKGELRLPGEAYSRTHPNLRRTMPGRASLFGGEEEHIVQYFTGKLAPMLKRQYDILETGTAMHEQIQDHLAAEGLLVQAETLVIDTKNDITGHIDAIIRDGRGGRGKRALEIKTIGDEALMEMDGPKYQHVGQINFYLRQLGLKKGTILYVSRENPANVRTFEVNYSENRWQKDLRKLQKSRAVAADLMHEGIVDTTGASYSWLDRLNILADVGPSSKEFKEAKQIVEAQLSAGQLTQDEITQYKTALKHRQARIRSYELYPDRFRGQLLSPNTQYNSQSINEDIKAAAEYSLPERTVGWIWEHFTNSNNILSNKLFAVKDPMEHYEMTRLYGKEYKPWDEPIRSWMEPYSRGLISKTGPTEGALSFGTGGFVLGGPIGAAVGSIAGSAYGTVHGLYRWATGTKYIPNIIDDKRQLENYFDAAKYEKMGRLASLSDGLTKEQFMSAQSSTLTSLASAENSSVANLFRATPYTEKPYIEAFLNEDRPARRKEILNSVPKNLGLALAKQWSKHDQTINTDAFVSNTSKDISSGGRNFAFNKQILDPRVPLEDVKLKVIESQGYDAHEFGLGWNEQMLRIQNSVNGIHDANNINYNDMPTQTPDINPGQVRGAVLNLLHKSGIDGNANVYINNGRGGSNAVTIKIMRDRSNSVMNALRNREKYNG